MANSAPQVLRDFLRRKGTVAAYEAVTAVEAAGYRKQVGYQAISKAVKDGTVERIGERQPFSYRLVDDATGAGEQTAQPGNPPFAASLGVACVAATAQPERERWLDAADLVAGVFDADIAMTRADVVDQLDGKLTPQEVTEAMTELAHAGRLRSRFDREESANIYWLVEPDAASPVSVVEVEAEAEAALSAYVPLGDQMVAAANRQVRSTPPPAQDAGAKRHFRTSQSLADRVEAIAWDIEEAIGDACDAGLSHAFIKSLTVASGAAHRAARSLEA